MTTPNVDDVEDFIEKVDEISLLINGLKAGTISPEYIDRKTELQKQKEEDSRKAEAVKRALPISNPGPLSAAQPVSDEADAEAKKQQEEQQQERLMQKVAELKANLERKRAARARYEEYIKTKTGAGAGTDYTRWDMWCPEDEEDDMVNSCTPNSPEFRAMEKDINERHERMVEQRQIAERMRVAGNEAFKAGQYSEALRCYQMGVDAQKTNMALHANAAQAALKLQCYVQAIEHCGKVLSIADFLHNNLRDPLCAKAYLRRATAYRALGDLERAAADLASAVDIEPDNKELVTAHAKGIRDLEEHRKQKQVRKALKAGENCASSGLAIDFEKLRMVETLVQQLQPEAPKAEAAHGPKLPPKPASRQQGSNTSPASSAEVATQALAASQLTQVLRGDDASCVYLRECGGVKAAADLAVSFTVDKGKGASLSPVLDLLVAVCQNDGNLLQLSEHKSLLPAVVALLHEAGTPAVATAAARLLYTMSTVEEGRKAVSKHLGKDIVLSGVLWKLATADSQIQALTLLLLSNCMVDDCCKTAMCKVLTSPASPKELSKAQSEAPLAQSGQPGSAVACLQKLVQSGSPEVAERALTMLGNMCGHTGLRAALQTSPALLTAVVEALVSASKASTASSAPVCAAAATALYNLAVDPPTQAAVASSGKMAHLLSMLSGHDKGVVARVAGAMSRCAKLPRAAALMSDLQAVPSVLKLAAASLDVLVAAHGPAPAAPPAGSKGWVTMEGEDAASLDAAVRTLTLLTVDGDHAPSCVQAFLVAEGVALFMRVLAEPRLPQSVHGNAALAVSNVAKQAQNLAALRAYTQAPQLPKEGEVSGVDGVPSIAAANVCLVASLLRVAYLGQGNTASKNAAIALARMAQDAQMLARLKELRGLEIIYSCARP